MGRQVTATGQAGTDVGAARGVAAGGQRTLQRHRGFRGYINLNSRGQTGNPTAPAILQNFLGSNPQDLITQGLRRGTPLLVDFGFAILDSLENEIPDLSDGVLGAGGRAALSTIPSALVRWNEESRVIDGDSMHDCVTSLKPSILETVEKVREDELAERRSKKKKSKEEEEKKKAEDEKAAQEQQTAAVPQGTQALALSTNYDINSTSATGERRESTTIIPDELDDTVSMQPPPAHPMAQPISIHELSNVTPNGSNTTMTEMLTPTQQQEQALRSAFQSIAASTSEVTTASILNVGTSSLDSGSARTTVQYQPPTITTEDQLANDTLVNSNASSVGVEQLAIASAANSIETAVVPSLPFSFQQPPEFAVLLGQANAPGTGLVVPPTPPQVSSLHTSSNTNFSSSERSHLVNPQLAILTPTTTPTNQHAHDVSAGTGSSTEELDVLMTSEPPSTQSREIWQDSIQNNVLRTTDASTPDSIVNLNPIVSVAAPTLSTNEAVAVSNEIPANHVEQKLTEDNGVQDHGASSVDIVSTHEDPVPGPSGITVPRSSNTNNTASNRDDFSSVLGMNLSDLPEGVDPSFLAALPEDMRQEVIDEQRRLQTIRQRAAQNTEAGVSEVNPEFLAALPPNIQEEVLAQQRMEQQRQAAAAVNPEEPVDPGEFLQTLPAQLRQSVLADMEESQIPSLPAEYAAEAQNLRREIEQRNRAMMHERFFSHVNHSGSALSSILRNTVSRIGKTT